MKYLPFVLAILLAGCFSSHKTKISSTAKVDSINVRSTHMEGIRQKDSSTAKQVQQQKQTTWEVELDTLKQDLFSGDETEAKQRAVDLAGPETAPTKKRTYKATYNGRQFESTQPIKKITVTDADTHTSTDITSLVTKDSGQINTKDTTALHKDESSKNKTVDRSGANPLVWLGVAMGLLMLACCGFEYGWFFPVSKRKNNNA